jgi:hypothetical protein
MKRIALNSQCSERPTHPITSTHTPVSIQIGSQKVEINRSNDKGKIASMNDTLHKKVMYCDKRNTCMLRFCWTVIISGDMYLVRFNGHSVGSTVCVREKPCGCDP